MYRSGDVVGSREKKALLRNNVIFKESFRYNVTISVIDVMIIINMSLYDEPIPLRISSVKVTFHYNENMCRPMYIYIKLCIWFQYGYHILFV